MGSNFQIEASDCLTWFTAKPADSIDLVFGSPPYEKARLYLENGKNLGVARDTEQWVAWMIEVYKAALRCCKGLVAFVVQGQTKNYRWTASPALLMADLTRSGICLYQPPIYHRVGIPGSGGNRNQHAANGGSANWLRNDYEFIICATRGGKLPWADTLEMGTAPIYEPGGNPSHRSQNDTRVESVYDPPAIANPGNVIRCKVGGGNMGDRLCHENEAPFPELLAEFFVRSFCPSGGVVCDPFCGSGTTAKMAIQFQRHFRGCDLRESQVQLTRRRLANVQPVLMQEV